MVKNRSGMWPKAKRQQKPKPAKLFAHFIVLIERCVIDQLHIPNSDGLRRRTLRQKCFKALSEFLKLEKVPAPAQKNYQPVFIATERNKFISNLMPATVDGIDE